jgi:hypothetical protein
VLESCAKLERPLKRLVLTSSMAAVHFSPKLTPDSVIDETFFSDPDIIRKIPTIVSTHPFKNFIENLLMHDGAHVSTGHTAS